VSVRLLICGDGKHELGQPGEHFRSDDPNRELPALPRLVHRLLGEPPGFACQTMGWKDVTAAVHPGKGHAHTKKVIVAALQARKSGLDGMVVLVDRDRKHRSETIEPLTSGRESPQCPQRLPIALGVAIETFDAWMICDGSAVAAAGGDQQHSHSRPENLRGSEDAPDHPKVRAALAFGGGGLGAAYKRVAQLVRLDELEKSCPDGFGEFAKDVRAKLVRFMSS
jgi:hypothetical protein